MMTVIAGLEVTGSGACNVTVLVHLSMRERAQDGHLYGSGQGRV